MFENLTERLNKVFQDLRRRGKLSETDVDAVMREVRLALLEADVHYSVVKDFVARVRERAIGQEVSRALNPAQQVIKIVHEELIRTLGEAARLNLTGPRPHTVMLVGLQGSGKTTVAAKLAKLLRAQGERILLVAADPYRPAAVKQLQTLGDQIGVDVFSEAKIKPPEIVAHAYEKAQKANFSLLIIDTAGRSQLDQELMTELSAIVNKVSMNEILLVADAMLGQEALRVAEGFRDTVNISGLIMTKIDGDARGGASISIRSVTGVPIKYLGTGEGLDALETFEPQRLASRILGMGDVLGLIEKAEISFNQEQAEKQTRKMLSGEFSLLDFADQLKQIRKMGPLSQLMEMFPGQMGQMARSVSPQDAEKQFNMTEAIINSMTLQERKEPDLLNASRRRRIAGGSGTEVQDVNRLIKQFRETQRLFKQFQKPGGRSGLGRLFG